LDLAVTVVSQRDILWSSYGEWTRSNSLLVVVQGDGKVLPVLLVDRDRVEAVAVAVQDLEVALVGAGLANDSAGLELDLVRRVVGRLVPDVLRELVNAKLGYRDLTYQILVRQVERPRRILLYAEMESLHTNSARPIRRGLQELQTRTPETVLLLEDALV
jgi:hypothetical protein